MIKFDEDALICDLAETYQIYDYQQLPPYRVAIFAIGLRENSRIKMKFSGTKVPLDVLLQSAVVDRLGLLVWAKTEDGQKGRNRPKSVVESLFGEKTESEVSAFTSGEEFEKERQRLLKGGN